MNRLQEQFMELLRSGLWGTPACPELFDGNTDWEAIYRAAMQQTVAALILDGVETLPKEQRPERRLYLKWCTQTLQLEEQNQLLDQRIEELSTLLRAEGIDPVLMKGQGVARNYRKPEHRTCGDIDLYIGKENFERVNTLLLQEAHHLNEDNYKHTSMEWRQVSIENHQLMAVLNSPSANNFFQHEIGRWHGKSPTRQVRIGQTDVTLMPVDFECVYLLVHALKHFLTEGVGLRQVCDWTCLLQAQHALIHPQEVERLLKGTGLRRGAGAFGYLASHCLGLSASCLPFALTPKDCEWGRFMLEDIWKTGNFGFYGNQKLSKPKGHWSGKWHTFQVACKRSIQMRRLMPAEAYWQPIAHVQAFLQAQQYIHRKQSNGTI